MKLVFLVFVFLTIFFYDRILLKLSQKPTLSNNNTDKVFESNWKKSESLRKFLHDQDNKVSDEFKVSPFFYPSVHFWFLIYTQYTSEHVLIHDKSNLEIIYKIYDFSYLDKASNSNRNFFSYQQTYINKKIKEFKSEFDSLIRNPYAETKLSLDIFSAIRESGTVIPNQRNKRVVLFKKLKENIRSQTGQKNYIENGLERFAPFKYFLVNHFKRLNLPIELLALPFLESSFNPKARSKVNALGVWQFMPLTSSYFIPKKSLRYDYRSSIGISSLAAAFLMAENYSILKSWDLAITAYNSGPKYLRKKIKEFKDGNVDLEKIIKHSDSPHFGFASRNFYSEFLALSHALAYDSHFFKINNSVIDVKTDDELRFYMAKCDLNLRSNLSEDDLNHIFFFNDHTPKNLDKLPKGFILNSINKLPQSTFFEVPKDILVKSKPKNWPKLISRQSCSTR